MKFELDAPCAPCRGTGRVLTDNIESADTVPCHDCNGVGRIVGPDGEKILEFLRRHRFAIERETESTGPQPQQAQ